MLCVVNIKMIITRESYECCTLISFIIILLAFPISAHNKEIPNCNYEDTVDLTNVQKFENDSYYYESAILIPPERIGYYDFEELHNGRRVPVKPHLRGCVCDKYRCLKFCCHPTKELIADETRQCGEYLQKEIEYDPHLSVILKNGSRSNLHALNDFFIVQGVPCEYAYAVVPEEDDLDGWDLFENGTLYRHYDKAYIRKRDYCIHPYQLETGEWVLNPMNCPVENVASLSSQINNIAMAISVPFIILTILVYAFLPELRNLHGKCLISYLTSLAIGYSLLCTVTLTHAIFPPISCSLLGYSAYFFLMAVFFWLSIISYDLWQNFRFTGSKRLTQRKRFLMYSLYAWGGPLILTVCVIIAQASNLENSLKPGIGDEYCWLKTDDWSAMIYFFGINLVIIIVNVFMFVFTMTKIIQIQKELQRALDKEEKTRHLRTHRNNVALFLRLFIIMGISWLLDIISYLVGHNSDNSGNFIFYISDFMNAIQGVLIFILFVLKPKVWKLLKGRLLGNKESNESTHSEYSDDGIALQERIKTEAVQYLD
ncbi:G-protein coupled receptor Mth2-like isoform 3-T3 [Glossina fuscipes fuscipes]